MAYGYHMLPHAAIKYKSVKIIAEKVSTKAVKTTLANLLIIGHNRMIPHHSRSKPRTIKTASLLEIMRQGKSYSDP